MKNYKYKVSAFYSTGETRTELFYTHLEAVEFFNDLLDCDDYFEYVEIRTFDGILLREMDRKFGKTGGVMMKEVYVEIVQGFRVDLDCHTYRFVIYSDPDYNNVMYESKRYITKDECKQELYDYAKDNEYRMFISGLTDINDFMWE